MMASTVASGIHGTKKDRFSCEDNATSMLAARLLNATRLSDGALIALKIVRHSNNPEEVEISKFLTSEPLQSDTSNHCVPIYDTVLVPDDDDIVIMVMPLLRKYISPAFHTVGEAIECFRQILEGLQFMHKNLVAHRDCMNLNIMMDANNLYVYPFHPVDHHMKRDFSGYAHFKTRTERPPKYYFIDFGLSHRYVSIDNALDLPVWGGDKQVPEFRNYDCPHNPFPTDVFYIGHAIKEDFLDVLKRFETIWGALSKWKLRSRVVDSDESTLEQIFGTVWNWARQLEFVVRRLSAHPWPAS
ncbi:hypothetical protein SCLCIDRAFT_18292 [Scleroderma citrinum Foug A]|uniref:Protein kinase domain-containing protein n=1 Tax=Scleroderma citrinum Foug A TaxID=1036808 RepID=A0A0C2ZGL9_9AGAM|nr:hypothetical protein SCLCIDRAFT_18292 [Scleroderma citrinum Foug A]